MDQTLITHYRNVFNEIARTHLVPDQIPDECVFVFILESPHIQELKFGAPVSGASGLSMTQHLFKGAWNLPLGQLTLALAQGDITDPSVARVGLMNACQVPLQMSAYKTAPVAEKYRTEMSRFESIRTANGRTKFTDEHLEAIQQVIASSLRKKLNKLTERKLYMIPCGRFAQKFAHLASVPSPNWEWIEGIPHPSYNNWSKPDYRPAVTRLTDLFTQVVQTNQ